MNTNEPNNKFLPIAVIIAGLFIAGAVIWSGSHPKAAPTGAAQAGTGAATVDIKNVKIDGDPYIGAASAPVTIAFWSDFQCPYCRNFELGTLPQIIKNYVDTGKVKIVMMDFTFLGPDSTMDAEYSRAVWKLYPNLYFAWRTALFNAQPQENSLSEAENLAWLKKTTTTVSGIDVNKVAADAVANKSAYDAATDADKAEAQKAGVNATPSFVIGTQMIAGAYPYPTFQAAIDALLK